MIFVIVCLAVIGASLIGGAIIRRHGRNSNRLQFKDRPRLNSNVVPRKESLPFRERDFQPVSASPGRHKETQPYPPPSREPATLHDDTMMAAALNPAIFDAPTPDMSQPMPIVDHSPSPSHDHSPSFDHHSPSHDSGGGDFGGGHSDGGGSGHDF